jgi:hypothetical protein
MAVTTFRYTGAAAKKHTIAHNLDCSYPVVSVYDIADGTTNFKQELSSAAAIKFVDNNHLTVEFSAAVPCVVSIVAF